jgi:hypothetical protein
MEVDGPVANVANIAGSAAPRFPVFYAWWSIFTNPRRNTLLRWAARPPRWWIVSSLLLGMALWGISSAFIYGREAFIYREGRALPIPPPSTVRLLSDGLVGGASYLVFAVSAAALLALLTPRTIGRFSTRYWRAFAVWTISLVGPLTLEAIVTTAIALLASLPSIATLVNPASAQYDAFVGGLILLIVYISASTAGYLFFKAIQSGRASMGRGPTYAFVLLAALSLVLNLCFHWGTAAIGILH